MNPSKPDYVIDAPGVIRNLLVVAILGIGAFGSLRPDVVTARKPAA